MRAAVLYGFNDIRIEEMPVPDIGDREALVRIRASGICSGDLMPWYIEKKAPLVLGHEPAGEIVKVGDKVERFGVGDRVFVHHHAPCLSCARCSRGDHVHCPEWRSSGIDPGGIAELVRVPEINLCNDTHILPHGLTFEHGVLVEPLACVLKGLSRVSFRREAVVLVIGLGVMGQLHICALKNMGRGRILGADSVPFRLEKAKEMGADGVINVEKEPLRDALAEKTDGEMANLVVVCPSDAMAMEEGLACVADGGTVLFFSPARPEQRINLDPNSLYFRDISLVNSYSAGPDDTVAALDMIRTRGLPTTSLITHRFRLEQTADAFRLASKAANSLKVVIGF